MARAYLLDWINDARQGQPALDPHGNDRAHVWVINATHVIDVEDYPPGTKIFLRAQLLHPGATPTLLDPDGHRVTAFLTNSPRWRGPFLNAHHRGRGRCENRTKTLKNTGLRKLLFFDFAANQTRAHLAVLVADLLAWLQLAAVPDGH